MPVPSKGVRQVPISRLLNRTATASVVTCVALLLATGAAFASADSKQQLIPAQAFSLPSLSPQPGVRAIGGGRIALSVPLAVPSWQSSYPWSTNPQTGYVGWSADKSGTDFPAGYRLESALGLGQGGTPGLWAVVTGHPDAAVQYRPGKVSWNFVSPGSTKIASATINTSARPKIYAHHCTEFGLDNNSEKRDSVRDCNPPAGTEDQNGFVHRQITLQDPSATPTAKRAYFQVDMPPCQNPADTPCSKHIPPLDPVTNGWAARMDSVDLVLTDDDLPVPVPSGPFYALDDSYINGQQDRDLTIAATDAGSGVQRVGAERTGYGTGSGEFMTAAAPCDPSHSTPSLGGRICPESWTTTLSAPASTLPEGRHDFRAFAQDPALNTGRSAPDWTVYVDRTGPSAPAQFTTEYDDVDSTFHIEWVSDDPSLADASGADGSGTERAEIRFKVGTGAWSDWLGTEPDAAHLAGLAPGNVVSIEVATYDEVGNRSSVTATDLTVPAAAAAPSAGRGAWQGGTGGNCSSSAGDSDAPNNLWVRAMEVTQGTQGLDLAQVTNPHRAVADFANTIHYADAGRYKTLTDFRPSIDQPPVVDHEAPMLVANKRTLVRIYGATNGTKGSAAVTVSLLLLRPDGSLLGARRRVKTRVPTGVDAIQRNRRSCSALVLLPKVWLERIAANPGAKLLATVVGRGGFEECADCRDAANRLVVDGLHVRPSQTVPYGEVRFTWTPINVPIGISGAISQQLEPFTEAAVKAANDLMPLSPGSFTSQNALGTVDPNIGSIAPVFDAASQTYKWDCGDILDRFDVWVKDKGINGGTSGRQPAPGPAHRTVGWMPRPIGSISIPCLGIARMPGKSMLSAPDGSTLTHEFGHNMGLTHASAAHGETGVPPDDDETLAESWPDLGYGVTEYQKGPTAPVLRYWGHGSIHGVGVNLSGGGIGATPSVKNAVVSSAPTAKGHPHDVMSYGQNAGWISPVTWDRMIGAIATRPTLPPILTPVPPVAAPVAPAGLRPASQIAQGDQRDRVVLASIQLADPKPEIRPLGEMRTGFAPDPPEGDGTYRFIARDAAGVVVMDHSVSVGLDSGGGRHVLAAIRLPASAVVLQFVGSGQVIAERRASANPPTVAFVRPKAGEVWREGRSYKVSHSATDPDGDTVLVNNDFRLDNNYAPFGGRTEDTVRSFLAPANGYPPTKKASFSLRATDGWHTVVVNGPQFTVLRRTRVHELSITGFDPSKAKKRGVIEIDPASRYGTVLYAASRHPNNFKEIKYIRWYWRGRLIGRGTEFNAERFLKYRGKTITLLVRSFAKGLRPATRRVKVRFK